ncbi:MAG: hypothetical protein V3W44_10025 [Dehalococcoidales bacterium]
MRTRSDRLVSVLNRAERDGPLTHSVTTEYQTLIDEICALEERLGSHTGEDIRIAHIAAAAGDRVGDISRGGTIYGLTKDGRMFLYCQPEDGPAFWQPCIMKARRS